MNVLGSVFLGDAQRQRVLSQSTATPPTSPRSSSPQTQVFPQRMGGTSTFPRVDAGQASSSSPLPIEPKLSLELRIRWLEVLLLGVRHDNWDQGVISRSTGGSKDLSNHPKTDAETLVRKAEGAQKRFNGIVNGNDGLRKFIDRFDQHSNILNPSFALSGSTSPPTYSSMSSEELDALLAEMEPEIRAAERDLREIDMLEKRGVLGAGKLPDHEALQPRLDELQKAHTEDIETATDLERRIANVLRRYTSRVDALSELFVEWNDVLNLAEDRITRLERERVEKHRLGLE